jgi:MFS superfamily sulfate permease-like transporter
VCIRARERQDEIDFLFSSDDRSRRLDSFASPMAECDGAGRRNVSSFSSSDAKETSRLRWLPGLAALRSYESAWLKHDLVAGIVLTTMLAPVGIAYAVASGVGPIYGLYATIACLLAYALFGPSRILVLGPDSSLAAVILGVIAPLSVGDPQLAIALAGVMALVSGAILIVAGIARLGFVTELLSKPIRYGYMNGIALTVLISQLPKLFGFKISSAGPLRDLWSIAGAIASGKVNWVEFALGAATLAVILLVKSRKRFPGILDKLKRFGLFNQIGEESFFATIGEAVDEYERVGHSAWRPPPTRD